MLGKNLVLIGMPGAGKTTLGNYLSAKLDIPFLDTDIYIEQTAGKSVMEIFSCSGEDEFRLIEREIISKASMIRNIIIATGGGAWTDSRNRKNLTDSGIVVYLDCSLKELWNRLENSRQPRPLLKDGFESLSRLYSKRHNEYKLANHIIDTTGKSVKKTGEELIEIFCLEGDYGNPIVETGKEKGFFGDRECDILRKS
jgi:shikimate kinase